MPAHLSATFSSACSVKTGRKTSPLIRALAPLRCIHARYRHSRTDKLFSLNHLKIGGKQDGNAKFAKERAELEEKERAAKAVADVARKQIDAAKRQVTEAIENRELTGAIARAKFAIESALDAYSRAADTVIEVGRLDKVEASKLLDDMAESSQSIVAKFVKTLKSE